MQVSPRIPSSPAPLRSATPPPPPQGNPEPSALDTLAELGSEVWQDTCRRWKEDGGVYVAGAGLYAGLGAAVGSVVGAPLVGAVKGLEIFAIQAGGDAVMNTETFENKVFNWSKTMPASPETPHDLDYEDPKVRRLFNANLATNAAVVLSVPAAMGAVLFGLPGALAVGALALAAAPFAELMA